MHARSTRSSQSGFSLPELLVALSLGMVMVSTSIYAFMPARRVYGVDETAGQIKRFMREASTRALTHRQAMRIFVNSKATSATVPNATPAIICRANSIMLIDENNAGTGDEVMVRSEPLYAGLGVTIGRPTNLPSGSQPAAPFNFAAASFGTGGTWECYFQPTGKVTNSSGVPTSATMYFYTATPTAPTAAFELSLVRALTIFGPTGNVRFWRYSPTGQNGTWIGR
jgi:prepilin-type N-terminal cleavage/methylation domain-containing protein